MEDAVANVDKSSAEGGAKIDDQGLKESDRRPCRGPTMQRGKRRYEGTVQFRRLSKAQKEKGEEDLVWRGEDCETYERNNLEESSRSETRTQKEKMRRVGIRREGTFRLTVSWSSP